MVGENYSQDEFDGSERATTREVVALVVGNGKPGMNARLRRVEWVLYVVGPAVLITLGAIIGFVLSLIFEGRIDITP